MTSIGVRVWVACSIQTNRTSDDQVRGTRLGSHESTTFMGAPAGSRALCDISAGLRSNPSLMLGRSSAVTRWLPRPG